LLGLASTCACATAHPATHPKTPMQVMTFPPVTIVAGPAADKELWTLNDQELFAKGKAAFASGNFGQAFRYFDRGADAFPQSPLHDGLAYNAGLAHLQLHDWAPALERFKALADVEHGQNDALDAAFQEATCLYFLEDFAEAEAVLAKLSERHDIPESQRLQAAVDRAVCQVELNRYSEAEHNLREALKSYRSDSAEERMPDDVAGKAEFFMGEIYRIYFSAVELDPANSDIEKLGQALEQKAEELLSAQGHYLRAIRTGTPHWATGAGFRIGALYEELYDALTNAPLPKDLDAEAAAVYREELKRRIRVLVTKAINIYDETLAAADRIGEDNPFISQTKESLNRMKAILLTDPAAASAVAPPAKPAPAPALPPASKSAAPKETTQ
jgi:tetratricopeptide (TPR) repeat protein